MGQPGSDVQRGIQRSCLYLAKKEAENREGETAVSSDLNQFQFARPNDGLGAVLHV